MSLNPRGAKQHKGKTKESSSRVQVKSAVGCETSELRLRKRKSRKAPDKEQESKFSRYHPDDSLDGSMGPTSDKNSQYEDEREQFLRSRSALTIEDHTAPSASITPSTGRRQQAKLARQETIDSYDLQQRNQDQRLKPSCARMMVNSLKRKRIFIPLLIVSCIAAIYCVPYVEIDTRTRKRLPDIPFNFLDGPLKPSSASQFKTEHLFYNQVQGPESIALDSQGNMYMAIEGGFILYAHMNRSSPIKKHYYEAQQASKIQSSDGGGFSSSQNLVLTVDDVTNELVKIAELNGIKQMPRHDHKRRARDGHLEGGAWKRECQLDEKIYGSNLHTGGLYQPVGSNSIDNEPKKFKPNVFISRCSRPLGVRLSPDESYLYVVDTLGGLYRVSLKVAERPYSTQRLVTKIVDFRTNKSQLLPVVQIDSQQPTTVSVSSQTQPQPLAAATTKPPTDAIPVARGRAYLNITLQAIDDLVIDFGAGTRGGDMIYMSDASQNWQAFSFLYDLLEGRPSGVVLRYDSGINQLSVLDPQRIAQVRTSAMEVENESSRLYVRADGGSSEPYMGIGAPHLDENDVFDDRPLHFPNGLEIMDDRQAMLIVDTANKRIIKHHIRGPRRGTSDLWAWTPNYADNIRRGYNKSEETYWVVGCGKDMTNGFDLLNAVEPWPRLRKFLLKNIYLFGWIVEMFGTHILRSTSVRDLGFSFKVGHALCENFCSGMMIIQYNKYGDVIKSIHSREFSHDLYYYSQVNEIIDAKNQEHFLYLSSPSYKYVTKLNLPIDAHPVTHQVVPT